MHEVDAVSAAVAFDILGVDHSPIELAVFGLGWTMGWLLLWRVRHLQVTPTDGSRPAVAVVIPARNEANTLPHLLRPLVEQRRDGDEIIVVDDHSDDETPRVARGFGVEVVEAPALPQGWLGKPHACWTGAQSSTNEVLVFLDADVRPGPSLLDELAAESAAHPDAVVSVQPWHQMETAAEQPSILCNITALMGSGAFTALGPTVAATVAFGPVIAVQRRAYDTVGGHGDAVVRSMHTEDIGLARAVGTSRLFVGRPGGTTFRMYPGGFSALVEGWGRSIATGARFTPWWLRLAVLAWVWSLAGGWIATPIVYPLCALQVWALGRRVGTTHPVAAALYPLLVLAFVIVFVRSLAAVVLRRDVTWKGRQVGARSG